MPQGLYVPPQGLRDLRRGFRKPTRPQLDPTHPINKGLISCYLLGMPVTGMVKDLGPFANDIKTLTGTFSVGAGHHGGTATVFDASTSYLTLPNSSFLNVYPITLSLWCYPTFTGNNTDQGLLNHYASGSLNGWLLNRNYNFASGFFRLFYFCATTGGSVNFNGTGAFPVNAWYHVAATVDASGGKLYVNGKLNASAAWTGTAGVCTSTTTSYIGNYPPNDIFGGRLADVRIYKRSLPATEIARLYAEPYAGILDITQVLSQYRVGAAAAATFSPYWATQKNQAYQGWAS